jgi:putative transposase
MEANTSYYIYNYSVQPELLFRNENDIELFVTKMEEHLSSVATIKKLLVNEFSFHALISFYELIDIKSQNSVPKFNSNKLLSRKLSNCFNAYAQSYNSNHFREGNLFRKSFKQIEILEDEEFDELLENSITKNNLKVIFE